MYWRIYNGVMNFEITELNIIHSIYDLFKIPNLRSTLCIDLQETKPWRIWIVAKITSVEPLGTHLEEETKAVNE